VLNLQQGYFGAQENVLWLDGQPIALAPATSRSTPQEPGLCSEPLRAARRHVCRPMRASAKAPPRQVGDLLGVTEDHHSRW
jgi:hypothetical protein